VGIQKTPSGTRGTARPGLPAWITRHFGRWLIALHRLQGDRLLDMDLLYLTTVGARSGETRQTPLVRFADGQDAWLVVGSVGGAARHAAWYHNLVAHPDQVWVEMDGRRIHVAPEQLEGERREVAWRRIVALQPRYAGYQAKTDRLIPVIRLTPTP